MPTPRIKAFWGGGKGIECRHPLKNLKGLSSPKYFATNLSTQLYWWLSPTLCSVRFLCLFSLSIFYRVSIKVNKANEIENLNKVIKGMRSNFIKMKRTERLAETPSTSFWGLRGRSPAKPPSPILDKVPANKVGHRRVGVAILRRLRPSSLPAGSKICGGA